MYITKFLVDYCIYPVIFFKFRKLSFFIKRQPGSSVFNDNLDNLDNFCYPDPADGVAVVGNKCCLSSLFESVALQCPSCRLIKNKLSFNKKTRGLLFLTTTWTTWTTFVILTPQTALPS